MHITLQTGPNHTGPDTRILGKNRDRNHEMNFLGLCSMYSVISCNVRVYMVSNNIVT